MKTVIRQATLEDTKAIVDIYQDYILHDVATFEYVVPSHEEYTRRMKYIQKTFPYLVYEEDGCILGYAYASQYKERAAYEWSVELSIYIDKKACRKGIGKTLYKHILAILKQQGIRNAYACITYPNEASVALHKTFGFKEIGVFHHAGFKFHRWLDVLWMECFLNESINDPKPRISIHKLDLPQILEEIKRE